MTGARTDGGMLLDQLIPAYDAGRIDHRVIDGELEEVYDATVRRTSFAPGRTLRRSACCSPFAASASGLRRSPAEIASMRLAEMPVRGDWVLLGEERPHEIAFGVIGRFWAGETIWEQINAADYVAFDRPGLAKIACSFSLRPYGKGRTLVSYETRTKGTDEAARRGFMRYWRPLSPFIGIVMRSQLRVIDDQAAAIRRRSAS
jgi:hypothetical protein